MWLLPEFGVLFQFDWEFLRVFSNIVSKFRENVIFSIKTLRKCCCSLSVISDWAKSKFFKKICSVGLNSEKKLFVKLFSFDVAGHFSFSRLQLVYLIGKIRDYFILWDYQSGKLVPGLNFCQRVKIRFSWTKMQIILHLWIKCPNKFDEGSIANNAHRLSCFLCAVNESKTKNSTFSSNTIGIWVIHH